MFVFVWPEVIEIIRWRWRQKARLWGQRMNSGVNGIVVYQIQQLKWVGSARVLWIKDFFLKKSKFSVLLVFELIWAIIAYWSARLADWLGINSSSHHHNFKNVHLIHATLGLGVCPIYEVPPATKPFHVIFHTLSQVFLSQLAHSTPPPHFYRPTPNHLHLYAPKSKPPKSATPETETETEKEAAEALNSLNS